MVNNDKNLYSHKGSYKFIEAIKKCKTVSYNYSKNYIVEIMF